MLEKTWLATQFRRPKTSEVISPHLLMCLDLALALKCVPGHESIGGGNISYDADGEQTRQDYGRFMFFGSWSVRTNNALVCGAPNELVQRGMLYCTFRNSRYILGELL